MSALSLQVFKASVDGACSSLLWWVASLAIAGWLEPDDLEDPFHLKLFCDSMIMGMFFF